MTFFGEASMQTQGLELIFWVVIVIAGILAYMLPTIVAVRLNHDRPGLITFLNVTIGWTGVAWVALLLWAMNTEYLYSLITRGRTSTDLPVEPLERPRPL